jgi:hypothetical protein
MSAPDFSLDRLPEVPYTQLPAEVTGAPFAASCAEFERLRNLFQSARSELAKLAQQAPVAAARDKEELAAALAAGKPDPGDRHTAKLAKDFAAKKRVVVGLADATHKAHREMEAEVEAGLAAWTDALKTELDVAAEEAEKLAAGLGDLLAKFDGPRRALRWAEKAAGDRSRVGARLPSPTNSTPSVVLGASPWSRAQVLDALVATVR